MSCSVRTTSTAGDCSGAVAIPVLCVGGRERERERERESAGPMVIYTLTACQKAFVLLETLVSYSAYLVWLDHTRTRRVIVNFEAL